MQHHRNLRLYQDNISIEQEAAALEYFWCLEREVMECQRYLPADSRLIDNSAVKLIIRNATKGRMTSSAPSHISNSKVHRVYMLMMIINVSRRKRKKKTGNERKTEKRKFIVAKNTKMSAKTKTRNSPLIKMMNSVESVREANEARGRKSDMKVT